MADPLSFKEPGGVGARIRPGGQGSVGQDALLLDLNKGFFAVADGAGRAPGASRSLLTAVARWLEGFSEINAETGAAAGKAEAFGQRFQRAIEGLLEDVPYGEATTFTGLWLRLSGSEFLGFLVHCGDSLLFQLTPETGIRQVSHTNFWLAGRSKKLYQAEIVPVPAGSVFLLATDGLGDLQYPDAGGRDLCLSRILEESPVENVPDVLLKNFDLNPGPVDDLALIAVRPAGLKKRQEQILWPV